MPKPALTALVLSVETSLLGALAIAGSRHTAGADRALLIVGWALLILSGIFALSFAARSELKRDLAPPGSSLHRPR